MVLRAASLADDSTATKVFRGAAFTSAGSRSQEALVVVSRMRTSGLPHH
jgi:hypothetical protein